jgi:hypothetical protein
MCEKSDEDDEDSEEDSPNKRQTLSTDRDSETSSVDAKSLSDRIKLRTLSLKSTSRQLVGKSVSANKCYHVDDSHPSLYVLLVRRSILVTFAKQ